jgi:hypothetical protein
MVESHRGVEVAFVEETALLVVAAAIFIWGSVSARLERADLTAPIVFTAIGAALAGLGLVNAHAAPEQLSLGGAGRCAPGGSHRGAPRGGDAALPGPLGHIWGK